MKCRIYERKLQGLLFARWIEGLANRKRAVWRDEIRSKIHSNYTAYSSAWNAWKSLYILKTAEKRKMDLAIKYANILKLRYAFDSFSMYRQLRSKKKELKLFAIQRANCSSRSAHFNAWVRKARISKRRRLLDVEAIAFRGTALKSGVFESWAMKMKNGRSNREKYQFSKAHYNMSAYSTCIAVWLSCYRKKLRLRENMIEFEKQRMISIQKEAFSCWINFWKLKSWLGVNEKLAADNCFKSAKTFAFQQWILGNPLISLIALSKRGRAREMIFNLRKKKDRKAMVIDYLKQMKVISILISRRKEILNGAVIFTRKVFDRLTNRASAGISFIGKICTTTR